jgi:hypothetical protein
MRNREELREKGHDRILKMTCHERGEKSFLERGFLIKIWTRDSILVGSYSKKKDVYIFLQFLALLNSFSFYIFTLVPTHRG